MLVLRGVHIVTLKISPVKTFEKFPDCLLKSDYFVTSWISDPGKAHAISPWIV